MKGALSSSFNFTVWIDLEPIELFIGFDSERIIFWDGSSIVSFIREISKVSRVEPIGK